MRAAAEGLLGCCGGGGVRALAGSPEARRLVDVRLNASLLASDLELLKAELGGALAEAFGSAVVAGSACGLYPLGRPATPIEAYIATEAMGPTVGAGGTAGRLKVSHQDSAVINSSVLGGCFQCSGYWTTNSTGNTMTCHGTVTEISCSGYTF